MAGPTRGVHHVGLTVLDCDEAAAWFVDALGFELIGRRPAYPAAFVSDGHTMLTLWQAADPDAARAFDRKDTIGLHHLALGIAPDTDLDALGAELAARDDVTIEFLFEPVGSTAHRHMMLRGPSGIRLELRWSPA